MRTTILENVADSSPRAAHGKARGLFWTGIATPVAAIAFYVVQFNFGILVVPWYVPVLTTLAALLLWRSQSQHRSAMRIVAFAFVGLLAVAEWYFFVAMSRLPNYAGPATVGRPIQSFQTTLADGGLFDDRRLRDGKVRILTFFRGRW